MPNLNTAALIKWTCPCPPTAPQPDADGSRLLVHVQDNAGNNFEIRCVRGVGGWNHWYEYSVSFPNGTSKEISKCIYTLGLNDVVLSYTGAMSQVTAPNGTPVINVGAITLVEHSNTEATGAPGAGVPLTPKRGGEDFHIFYLYARKLRYRVNTKVGTGVTSTEFLSSRYISPEHAILRADVMSLSKPEDFDTASAGDLGFRRLDYPRTEHTGEKFEFQDVDTDDSPIQFGYVEDPKKKGGILLDPTLKDSSVELTNQGLQLNVPGMFTRTRSTLAVERTLFSNKATALTVSVDGRKAKDVKIRSTNSMIAIDFPLDNSSHRISITEPRDRTKSPRTRRLKKKPPRKALRKKS